MKRLLIICSIGLSLVSCEFDYKSVKGIRTSNRTYIGQKIYDKKSGKTQILAPGINQLLVFTGDTMQIFRNDTVIERLISYNSKNWIGKRKYGKVLFGGFSKQGRKSFIIEILDPKNFLSGDVILGTIMQGDYDEKLDTTQTFYLSP